MNDTLETVLRHAGGNLITATAYDTAWVAAVPTLDGSPRFPQSLEWLRAHQHDDGSWGSPWPHYHDRLLCTLRAILTLRQWADPGDREAIREGVNYIWRNAGRRAHDPWETIGFELIFPALLVEAQRRGLPLPHEAFSAVMDMRAAKLAQVPIALLYRRDLPVVTNLEGLDPPRSPDAAAAIQDASGAVGISPAATACLLTYQPTNQRALTYLENALYTTQDHDPGGAPPVFPLETFELGWVLHALGHALPDLHRHVPAATPLLDFLYTSRQPEGWAASQQTSAKEADTTGICYTVLARAGYDLDPQLLYQYEEATHFRCYSFERNPSISANAHILDALRYCPSAERAPRVAKIERFLRAIRLPEGFWFDKWHTSPYYPTGHIILAAQDLAPELVRPAIEWITHTQWPDGGWGYYAPTPEETAHALLALLIWQRQGGQVRPDILARGAAYLQEHFMPDRYDYAPLWVHKALYVPALVAHASVLAALLAYDAQR